jgi:hypothetical protein
VSPGLGRKATRLDPVRKERPEPPTYQTSQIRMQSIYRFVKESFNSSLPYEVVLKYTQYCSAMAVDRRFCMISKGQKEDNTNPRRRSHSCAEVPRPSSQPFGLAVAEGHEDTARLKPESSISYFGVDPLKCLRRQLFL